MVDVSTSAAGQDLVVQYAEVGGVELSQTIQVPLRSINTSGYTPEELDAAEKQIEQRLASRRNRPRKREISGHDEASLSWYFGQGLSIYEKSTFGPIVQKIALDGYSSTQCGKCEGEGIIEEGGVRLEDRCPTCKGSRLQPRKSGEAQAWCSTCDGSGVVPPYEVATKWGWCPGCRGTGSGCVERRAQRRPGCRLCRPDTPITARVPRSCCWNCYGTGDEPISAQPVQVGDAGGGVLANDSALTSFAITSRRVDKVRQRSPAFHAALEAFYGDTGARWALSDHGRLFSLYHLTAAGKRLASWGREVKEPSKKARKKLLAKMGGSEALHRMRAQSYLDSTHLTAQEAIGVQAALERIQPHKDRRKLLQAAHQQASDLYERACNAWVSVSTSKGEVKRMKELAAKLEQRGHERAAAIVRMNGGAQ